MSIGNPDAKLLEDLHFINIMYGNAEYHKLYKLCRQLLEKNERLMKACSESYQVVGQMLLEIDERPKFTNEDVVRALDNLIAAINNEPEPHEDLLPWPKPQS